MLKQWQASTFPNPPPEGTCNLQTLCPATYPNWSNNDGRTQKRIPTARIRSAQHAAKQHIGAPKTETPSTRKHPSTVEETREAKPVGAFESP